MRFVPFGPSGIIGHGIPQSKRPKVDVRKAVPSKTLARRISADALRAEFLHNFRRTPIGSRGFLSVEFLWSLSRRAALGRRRVALGGRMNRQETLYYGGPDADASACPGNTCPHARPRPRIRVRSLVPHPTTSQAASPSAARCRDQPYAAWGGGPFTESTRDRSRRTARIHCDTTCSR